MVWHHKRLWFGALVTDVLFPVWACRTSGRERTADARRTTTMTTRRTANSSKTRSVFVPTGKREQPRTATPKTTPTGKTKEELETIFADMSTPGQLIAEQIEANKEKLRRLTAELAKVQGKPAASDTTCFECKDETPDAWLNDTPEGTRICDACQAERTPSKPARATKPAVAKTPKVLPNCGCGCGETTRGGKYRPGHDARHHSALKAAGLAVVLLSGKTIPAPAVSVSLEPKQLWKACKQVA